MRSRRRVVIHVGLPKTGTSFVQQVLGANAATLADAGVHVVDPDGRLTFLAVLDLRDAHRAWGRSPKQVKGRWRMLAEEVARQRGTAVISHELLSGASIEEVRRAMSSFGDAEVHVVVTVRDPWRQLAAEWQEGVKHGRTLPWPRFLGEVLDPSDSALSRRFWQVQDPVAVLDRWGDGLPPERVHVIPVPPSGSAPDVLWRRFATALGLSDEVEVRFPEEGINAAIGVVQTELLRRVNKRYRRKGRAAVYGQVVKRTYARRVLARFPRTRVTYPEGREARLRELAASWQQGIAAPGYAVVGDLAELGVAPPPDPSAVDPARVTRNDLLRMSLDATAGLLEEVERLQAENARLRRDR